MEELRVADALTAIFEIFRRSNKYIDETAPWVLAKDEAKQDRLATVLYNLTEAIAIGASLLYSFMPETSEKILSQISTEKRSLEEMETFGLYPSGTKVTPDPEVLFARADMKDILPKVEAIQEAQKAAAAAEAAKAAAAEGKASSAEAPAESPCAAAPSEAAADGGKTEGNAPRAALDVPAQAKGEINFEDFEKLEFRVGEVLACEKLPKSKKLLCFKVRIGNEERQILSGIQAYYEPEQLIGKKVIVAVNLAPRKMAGTISQGMLLSAIDDENHLSLLTTMEDMPAGSEVG